MTVRNFLAVVPRAMRVTACLVAALLVTAGLIGGALADDQKNLLGAMGLYWTAALVLGALSACWLLATGFVFADARRRGMRATLWTVVVILFPHFLGFLLYFVMRSPVSLTCAQCGNAVSTAQNFCACCGALRPHEPTSASYLAHRPAKDVPQ